MPPSFTVGSGFIVTPDDQSTQVDIMVCDDSAPTLFRDGDFMIAPADCVRAIVEVKTSINLRDLRTALEKLDVISRLMHKRCTPYKPFLGLFSYEVATTNQHAVLEALKQYNGDKFIPEISAMSLGDCQFYRYWQFAPPARSGQPYDSWHAYYLPGTAPGYFIHNLIEPLFPRAFERAAKLWFPWTGKEQHLVETIRRTDPTTT